MSAIIRPYITDSLVRIAGMQKIFRIKLTAYYPSMQLIKKAGMELNISKDDYSPEVYQIILEARKKEKTRKKIVIVCWALVLLALVMLFGGYSFIREQAAPYESPLIEHKLLTYIDITDEERLPPELIDTLCAEYVPENLKEFWDEPLEFGITDVNRRGTEASEELREIFRSIPDRTGVNLSSNRTFYYFNRNEHSINVTIRNTSLRTSAEWSVGYIYYDDGSVSKSLRISNERILLIASNYEGRIKIKYDPSLGLPDREISIPDYRNYMEARRTGKVSKQQLLSISKMQEYAKMNPDNRMPNLSRTFLFVSPPSCQRGGVPYNS